MATPASDNLPRLTMSYQVESHGEPKQVELPLVIAILGELSVSPGEPFPPLEDRKLLTIGLVDFNEAMKRFTPRVDLEVPHPLSRGSDKVRLNRPLLSLSEFEPEALIRNTDALAPLLAERTGLAEIRDKLRASPAIADALLEFMRAPGFHELSPIPPRAENSPGADSPERGTALAPYAEIARRLNAAVERAAELIGFVHVCLRGKVAEPGNLRAMVEERISDLDRALGDALNLILHHTDLQRLESTWRGVHHLVGRLGAIAGPICRIMHVTKAELEQDFRQAARFDRSVLFRKLREEFATPGGQPYSVIVASYAFDHHDTFLLDQLARTAQASSAVVIAGVAPGMMRLDDFSELSRPRDLSKIFQTVEHERWRELREMEFTSHVALSLPQMLGRDPWLINEHDSSQRSFDFEERIEKHSDYLWVNSAFALAERIGAAFERTGWFDYICGPQGGGAVESLPTHAVPATEGAGGLISFCPVEINISDRRELELCQAGFNSLVHCKGTDYAAFFHARTLYRPKLFDAPEATAADEAKTDLSVTLGVNRIVHYLLCQIRDKIGGFADTAGYQRALQDWLHYYVFFGPLDEALRYGRLLSSGSVDVVWAPESLGGPIMVIDLELIGHAAERTFHVQRKIPVSLRLE